ncbi:MAG TPA: SDR family oxidoreductase [Flavilitoribacter sp.]|nr:SDR family oxidoreductase [Flavilitoribacter sp.]HMQ86699.1 SDR family oxidoreductase [Flavilitoribacter sp.]
MDNGTKKLTALITGASGGIGLELARLMAKDGIHLVLADIREKELTEARELLHKVNPGIEISTIQLDLARQEAAEDLYNSVAEQGKVIDILVNNAGFGIFGSFAETDWVREGKLLNLHILTLTHLSKLFLQGMTERRLGYILNVSSVAGFQPSPLMAVYNASKAYVLSFSEAIANELKGTGVLVTVLCPGLTRTGFQATVGVGKPEMTASSWFSSSAEEVAVCGYNALMRGKTVAIPGPVNFVLAHAHRFFPRGTVTRLVRKVQEKNRSFVRKGNTGLQETADRSLQ